MMESEGLKRPCEDLDQVVKKQKKDPDNYLLKRTEDNSVVNEIKEEISLGDNLENDQTQEDEENTVIVIQEENVGITEYLSQHEGFSGIVKQRYSDFVVNERDLEDNMVELNDLSFPDLFDQIDIFSSTIKEELQKLDESKDETACVEIEVGDDKEYRTNVHQAIRKLFPDLESNTEDVNKKKIIRVKIAKKNARRKRKAWPVHKGNYCHFVLYKENKSTMEAINIVAKKLRMKPGAFTFSGTKDKRAKTSQKISVYRVDPAKLKRLNSELIDMRIGNFNFGKEPLKLGDLSGNHFKIILRDLKGSDDMIRKAMSSLQETGFINYYGMQRFGTTTVGTHVVGRALLHGLWSEAIELILKPREGENSSDHEWRKVWQETRNTQKALEKLSRRNTIEYLLLQGLNHHDNNLQAALSFIPRNSRLMYVHSYQSCIWNTIVSRRLRKYALQPLEGDLIALNPTNNYEDNSNIVVQYLEVKEAVKYTLHDILLPLPGYDVKYPKNEIGEWYKELLEEDKIDLNTKNKVRDYSLPGAYRKILVHPKHMTWSVMHYNDVNRSLILSDCDKLNDLVEAENISDGKFKALKLEFSLPPSSYATMLIREILKVDTSPSYQCTLNPIPIDNQN